MTLSHTISDLKLANMSYCESEKLTAFKLIQDNYTQMTKKTSAANQNDRSSVRLPGVPKKTIHCLITA